MPLIKLVQYCFFTKCSIMTNWRWFKIIVLLIKAKVFRKSASYAWIYTNYTQKFSKVKYCCMCSTLKMYSLTQRVYTYRVDTNSRWRIHCSGPDFTRNIYAVSKFHGVMHTWSCVRGICMCREACRLARISCHVEQGSKWRLLRHW